MIKLENVSKWYGEFQTLKEVSLEIREGETCVLLGPSGCGKSTTLRLINRLITPEKGRILLKGEDIRSIAPEKLRRGMGYVIQSIGLLPHLTVEQNILLVPRLLKWKESGLSGRAEELLELVGLSAEQYKKKYPHQLSGGEAQRIGVARALAADPPVLLMDEPFGAVDPLNRHQLQQEFLSLQKELKKSVIFVTHDLDEAVSLADRIAIMEQGEIRQYDSTPEILLHPGSRFVKNFIGEQKALKLLAYYNVAYAMETQITDREVVTAVRPEDSLKGVLARMLGEGVDTFAVRKKEESAPMGIITLKAILKLFIREKEQVN